LPHSTGSATLLRHLPQRVLLSCEPPSSHQRRGSLRSCAGLAPPRRWREALFSPAWVSLLPNCGVAIALTRWCGPTSSLARGPHSSPAGGAASLLPGAAALPSPWRQHGAAGAFPSRAALPSSRNRTMLLCVMTPSLLGDRAGLPSLGATQAGEI
jgi:hypothetical protein